MEEVWKDIKGYEGLYKVSNFGRVKSLCRKSICGSHYITIKEKILKPSKTGSDRKYLHIILAKDGINISKFIHRLVAEAFIPNPNNLPQINHKDEDPSNNCVYNLEWCDAKYNMNYGTINRRRGESLGYGKDNPYSIPIIQYDKNGEFIKEWDSTMDVERELHIQHSNITKCCKKQLHFKTAGGFIWRYKEKAV